MADIDPEVRRIISGAPKTEGIGTCPSCGATVELWRSACPACHYVPATGRRATPEEVAGAQRAVGAALERWRAEERGEAQRTEAAIRRLEGRDGCSVALRVAWWGFLLTIAAIGIFVFPLLTVVIAICVFLYWFFARKGRHDEERKRLRVFHYLDETPDDIFSRWIVDLAEMKAAYRFQVAGAGPERVTQFHVRRSDHGAWSVKHTYESWRDEVARLENELKQDSVVSHLVQERLDALRGGPVWGPLGDEMAGELESQYQRFVRQYREA